MLILSRKPGESIVIDGRIVVKIVRLEGDLVKLGIEAPAEVPVHRQEVYAEIQKNNQEAMTTLKANLPAAGRTGGFHLPRITAPESAVPFVPRADRARNPQIRILWSINTNNDQSQWNPHGKNKLPRSGETGFNAQAPSTPAPQWLPTLTEFLPMAGRPSRWRYRPWQKPPSLPVLPCCPSPPQPCWPMETCRPRRFTTSCKHKPPPAANEEPISQG